MKTRSCMRHSAWKLIPGCLAVLLVGMCASVASAQTDYSHLSRAGAESGVKTNDAFRDVGFYARGRLGLGFANSVYRVEEQGLDAKSRLSGLAIDWQAALGGVVAPNIAVYASFWGQTVPGPDIKFSADSNLGSSTDKFELDGRFSLLAIGPGMTGYIGDTGFFVAGSLGAVTRRVISYTDNGSDTLESPGWGFGFDISGGKEWQITNGLGMGFALGVGAHFIPKDETVSGFNVIGASRGVTASVRWVTSFN